MSAPRTPTKPLSASKQDDSKSARASPAQAGTPRSASGQRRSANSSQRASPAVRSGANSATVTAVSREKSTVGQTKPTDQTEEPGPIVCSNIEMI